MLVKDKNSDLVLSSTLSMKDAAVITYLEVAKVSKQCSTMVYQRRSARHMFDMSMSLIP